jgi:hypothetical protein
MSSAYASRLTSPTDDPGPPSPKCLRSAKARAHTSRNRREKVLG